MCFTNSLSAPVFSRPAVLCVIFLLQLQSRPKLLFIHQCVWFTQLWLNKSISDCEVEERDRLLIGETPSRSVKAHGEEVELCLHCECTAGGVKATWGGDLYAAISAWTWLHKSRFLTEILWRVTSLCFLCLLCLVNYCFFLFCCHIFRTYGCFVVFCSSRPLYNSWENVSEEVYNTGINS